MWFFDFLFNKNTPEYIEIDDSGSGSLYGGLIILSTDGSNNFSKEIPLKLFSIKDKAKRVLSIKKAISKAVFSEIKALKASKKKTKILICQGNLFDYAEKELKKKKYNVSRVKIEGRTNFEAEKAFKRLLEEKYNIKNYSYEDYKKENIRQYNILKERRDFKNVKVHSKGVDQIIKG